MSARSLVERARARNPLPDGTLTVAAGLVVNGLTAYAFLSLAARELGPEAFAPLSVLWAMVYLVGPGSFLPLEQEVSRALANRWARGIGSGPLARQAGTIGLAFAGLLVAVTFLAAPLMLDHLLDDEVVLLISFALAIVGYAAVHLARGVLAGMGRFRGYARYYTAENVIRLTACALLAAAGITTVGGYGLTVGLAPFLAVAYALWGERELVTEGPPAPWRELSRDMASLLAASALTAFLLYAGPLAVEVLAEEGDDDAVAQFFTGVVVARVPVFLFQAVQAALLPRLSALAGAGRFADFRSRLGQILMAVLAIGVVGATAALAVGPELIRLFFGDEFHLGRDDIALLALSSAAFMLAVTLGQALIALEGQGRVAVGWLLGTITFLVVTALGNDLFLRVELGLVAGSAVAALVQGALMYLRLHQNLRAMPQHDLVAD